VIPIDTQQVAVKIYRIPSSDHRNLYLWEKFSRRPLLRPQKTALIPKMKKRDYCFLEITSKKTTTCNITATYKLTPKHLVKTIYFDSLFTLSFLVIQNFAHAIITKLQSARSLVTFLLFSTTRPWYFWGIKTQGIVKFFENLAVFCGLLASFVFFSFWCTVRV